MRKPRRLSADENALWRKVAESVDPLPGRAATLPAEPSLSDRSVSQPENAQKRASTALAAVRPQDLDQEPKLPPHPLHIGERKGESAPGLDRRTHDKLRRGRFPIDGRIDLHGKTQEAAHRALNAFLAGAHHRGLRCVLVITGRGMRPVDGGRVSKGILKREAPRWLQEGENRRRVLAFATARPEHGGEGALYVLLRRLRD